MRYKHGDIAKIVLATERGQGKLRWVVVISDLVNLDGVEAYSCICITTTFPQPPPAVNFPIPWHPQGKVHSGLRRRSAAVLDWIVRVDPSHMLGKTGYLSKAEMDLLGEKLKQWNLEHPKNVK